jgi:NTP pyrophosphatase (non-canonical NTP hydrolase)
MNDTTIRAMARLVHETAKAKGWWDDFPKLCHACGFYMYREPCESCACGVSKLLRPTADERDFALRTITLLALVTTEVAEAIECVREGKYHEWTREDGKPEGLPSELADVVIRVFDLAEGLGIDIAAAIDRKHAFNATRSVRHGGKLA